MLTEHVLKCCESAPQCTVLPFFLNFWEGAQLHLHPLGQFWRGRLIGHSANQSPPSQKNCRTNVKLLPTCLFERKTGGLGLNIPHIRSLSVNLERPFGMVAHGACGAYF